MTDDNILIRLRNSVVDPTDVQFSELIDETTDLIERLSESLTNALRLLVAKESEQRG